MSIAFDLDGTLLRYDGWVPLEDEDMPSTMVSFEDSVMREAFGELGKPVPEMVDILKKHHAEGAEIIIFTARMDVRSMLKSEVARLIGNHLQKHGIPFNDITCTKIKRITKFYDDRAIECNRNDGVRYKGFISGGEVGRSPNSRPTPGSIVKVNKKELHSVVQGTNVDHAPTQVGGGHYKSFKIQPKHFCYQNNLDSYQSTILKYLVRHKFKGGAEDLDKAIDLLTEYRELEYD